MAEPEDAAGASASASCCACARATCSSTSSACSRTCGGSSRRPRPRCRCTSRRRATAPTTIMRTLTVLTAIFLPLNLVTGFFGMNFDGLPLIHSRTGFWVALATDARARHRPERRSSGASATWAILSTPIVERLRVQPQAVRAARRADAHLGPELAGDEARRHAASRRSPSAPCRCGSGCRCCGCVLRAQKSRSRSRARDWRELGVLTLTNMLVWHVLAILAVQALSSGRAAILGYTMPIFSALWGRGCLRRAPARRASVAGIGAAARRRRAAALARVRTRSPAGRWAAVGMLVAAGRLGPRHAAAAAHAHRGADARHRVLDDPARRRSAMTAWTVRLRARPLGAAEPGRRLGDRLQRRPHLRLRAADLAHPRAHPAADRVEHVGDADPGARHAVAAPGAWASSCTGRTAPRSC